MLAGSKVDGSSASYCWWRVQRSAVVLCQWHAAKTASFPRQKRHSHTPAPAACSPGAAGLLRLDTGDDSDSSQACQIMPRLPVHRPNAGHAVRSTLHPQHHGRFTVQSEHPCCVRCMNHAALRPDAVQSFALCTSTHQRQKPGYGNNVLAWAVWAEKGGCEGYMAGGGQEHCSRVP